MQVFRNGELLSLDSDYTFDGIFDITFVSAPADTDVITCNYATQTGWEFTEIFTLVQAFGVPENQTQNPYDADEEPPHYGRGFRLTNNVMTYNDCEFFIVFAGLNSALISQNYLGQLPLGGNAAIFEDSDLEPGGFDPLYTDSAKTAILDNTLIRIDGTPGAIQTTTPSISIDNVQVSPNQITRGGSTQNFYNIVQGEIPGGAINGSNVTFTLAHPPQTGTLELFLNGLLANPATDYTLAGSTVTMAVAPNPGSALFANYEW